MKKPELTNQHLLTLSRKVFAWDKGETVTDRARTELSGPKPLQYNILPVSSHSIYSLLQLQPLYPLPCPAPPRATDFRPSFRSPWAASPPPPTQGTLLALVTGTDTPQPHLVRGGGSAFLVNHDVAICLLSLGCFGCLFFPLLSIFEEKS